MEGQALAIVIIISVLFCNTGSFCTAAHNDLMVHIGVILNYKTWIGKVAKTAIEMAADDINRDTQLLNGSQLVVEFRDSQGDAVKGASAGNLHFLCIFFYRSELNSR